MCLIRNHQPRFSVVWDVYFVLNYPKKISGNDLQFSDKMLTLKSTMFKALTSTRSSGIHYLHITFTEMADSYISFSYNEPQKSCQKSPVINFHEFSNNENLCVVKTIKAYTERSVERKCNNNLVRYFWAISTQFFSAHSTRLASTSKATLQGATIEDILKRRFSSNRTPSWLKLFFLVEREVWKWECYQKKNQVTI